MSAFDFLRALRRRRSGLRQQHRARPAHGRGLTQNVFAKLIDRIQKYEPRDVPFCLDPACGPQRRTRSSARAGRSPSRRSALPTKVQDETRFDRLECLREALLRLPADQREVLVLRHVAGLSPTEIADRLGKSEGSVHGLHHRGRGALRAALRELEAAPVTASAWRSASTARRALRRGGGHRPLSRSARKYIRACSASRDALHACRSASCSSAPAVSSSSLTSSSGPVRVAVLRKRARTSPPGRAPRSTGSRGRQRGPHGGAGAVIPRPHKGVVAEALDVERAPLDATNIEPSSCSSTNRPASTQRATTA